MILYFSASGNSLSVAKQIAEATGDEVFDMGGAYKAGRFEVPVKQGENLGFVFPTHGWSTPKLVDEFVRKMTFAVEEGGSFKPDYVFSVETFGKMAGGESAFFAKLLQGAQGIEVDSSFSVQSVENCLCLFDAPDEQTEIAVLKQADEQAAEVIAYILKKERGLRVKGKFLGNMLSHFTGRDHKEYGADKFEVIREFCIGCGMCAKVCPTNTIRLVDDLPVWSGDDCTGCLACIHHCPKDATQHGKATVGRRRYLNPILR